MKLTIAIPIYSDQNWYKLAIESCLRQTVKEFELLLVINRPSDPEPEIFFRKWVTAHPDIPIRFVKNEQTFSMSENWNRCADETRTEWLLILHEDDALDSKYVEKILPALECRKEIGIILPRTQIIDAKGDPICFSFTDFVRKSLRPICSEIGSKDLITRLVLGNFIYMSNSVVRTELVQRIRFKEGIRFAPDWFFFMEAALAGVSVYLSNQAVGFYRRHSGSATARKFQTSERTQEELSILKRLANILKQRRWYFIYFLSRFAPLIRGNGIFLRLKNMSLSSWVFSILIFFRVWIAWRGEIWSVFRPHDDLLYIRSAEIAYWGQSTDEFFSRWLPLFKPPAFSLWIALGKFFHIPLKIFNELFFVFSIAFLTQTISRFLSRQWLKSAIFFAGSFHPVAIFLFYTASVDTFFSSVLFVLVAVILRQEKYTKNLLPSLVIGILAGVLTQTRTETSVVLFTLVLALMWRYILQSQYRKKGSEHGRWFKLHAIVQLGTVCWIVLAVCVANSSRYGLFVNHIPGSRAAWRVIDGVMSLKENENRRFNPVSSSGIQKAMELSPLFARLRPQYESPWISGPLQMTAFHFLGQRGQYGPWIFWGLWDLVVNTNTNDIGLMESYLNGIADELEVACARNPELCRKDFRSYLFPPLQWSDWLDGMTKAVTPVALPYSLKTQSVKPQAWVQTMEFWKELNPNRYQWIQGAFDRVNFPDQALVKISPQSLAEMPRFTGALDFAYRIFYYLVCSGSLLALVFLFSRGMKIFSASLFVPGFLILVGCSRWVLVSYLAIALQALEERYFLSIVPFILCGGIVLIDRVVKQREEGGRLARGR